MEFVNFYNILFFVFLGFPSARWIYSWLIEWSRVDCFRVFLIKHISDNLGVNDCHYYKKMETVNLEYICALECSQKSWKRKVGFIIEKQTLEFSSAKVLTAKLKFNSMNSNFISFNIAKFYNPITRPTFSIITSQKYFTMQQKWEWKWLQEWKSFVKQINFPKPLPTTPSKIVSFCWMVKKCKSGPPTVTTTTMTNCLGLNFTCIWHNEHYIVSLFLLDGLDPLPFTSIFITMPHGKQKM